mgnify:CR=1 FL=1
MPEGSEKFKSKMNKDAYWKFKIKGIYLYICSHHKSMGMVDLVVVEKDSSKVEKVRKLEIRCKYRKTVPANETFDPNMAVKQIVKKHNKAQS